MRLISYIKQKLLTALDQQELSKFSFLWCMLAFVVFAYSIGWPAFTAIFIKRIGSKFLPYLYMTMNLANILGAGIYLVFVDKMARHRLIAFFSFASGGALICARCLISNTFEGEQGWTLDLGLFLLLVAIGQGCFGFMLRTQIWTIARDSFSLNQGATVYPILGIAIIAGAACGGVAVQTLAFALGTGNMIAIWGALTFLMIPLTAAFSKKFGQGQNQSLLLFEKEKALPFQQRLKEAKDYFFLAPLPKYLGLISLFFWFLSGVQNFQYAQVINATFDAEVDLSEFLGFYTIFFNLSALFIQLFGAEKIIRSLGTFGSFTVVPLVTLFNFFVFTLFFGFWTGIWLHYVWDILNMTFQSNAYQQAYDVVPISLRGRVRGVMDGVFTPLGSLLGCLLLLLAVSEDHLLFSSLDSLQVLNIFAMTATLLWIFTALKGKKIYADVSSDLIPD